MSDVEATVKFAIRNAIVNTTHLTGIRAGDASEALVEEVYSEVLAQPVRWALREALEDADNADP